MIGFVTTGINGLSTITNISPSQSIISDTVKSSYLIAVTESDTTTTIELSSLPIASTFSQETAIETLTISDTPIVYSPTSLSGYSNIEPIEISTSFIETVNGQITTQWGWWLIGPYGHIDLPQDKPLRLDTSNFGCIGGPLLCNAPCGDVDVSGGWFIHITSTKCSSGITGLPGWPGGPIVFTVEPDDDPPPYHESSGDHENDEPDNCDEEGVECSTTTSTVTKNSVSSQKSSGSASKTAYFIIAATNAVQSVIERELQNANPDSGESYAPDVGDTEFSGGTWIDVDLTPLQASSISSRSDINLVMTCANATFFSFDPIPTTVSAATGVTMLTLTADATVATSGAKNRRVLADPNIQTSQESRFRRGENARLAKTVKNVKKRDAGTVVVRQEESPKDLSVLSWAPGVPSVASVDYIMQETKGEFTWVYVVDTGVDDTHWEFQDNWAGTDGFGKINIDPDWVWVPGTAHVKEDPRGHGTCMASKVCGRKNGVAKQTIVIPVVFSQSYESFFAAFELLENDITARRARETNKQALPGKTVVSISWAIATSKTDYIAQMKNALQAIMNLGVVIVVSADNRELVDGFVSESYPTALALLDDFPLIRVGAVDESGRLAWFSMEGDVYIVGVGGKCAVAGLSNLERDTEGTSGAAAAFAGLVAYMMGLNRVPFAFGSDITQYQSIVKDYFVYDIGAYVRPGGNAPVAWNGLDGSAANLCPLLRKRQDQPENICQSSSTSAPIVPTSTSSPIVPTSTTSPIVSTLTSSSIIPTQTAGTAGKINAVNIAIYYSRVEPCDLAKCDLTYYAYTLLESTDLPFQECGGAISQGNEGSDSFQFQLQTLTGTLETFTYSTSSDSAGTVTGDTLSTPIICSESTSRAEAWQCTLKKRTISPDTTIYSSVFYKWATCTIT